MKAKWILVVIVVVLVAAGAAAYGGYSYGMRTGQTQAANVRAGFLAERGLATGGAGGASGAFGAPGQAGAGVPGQGGGPQFNSGNFASGQVKQIDGDTLQISTANAVVTVKISDKTQIQKMGQAALSDIQPGERLTVQGVKGADGTLMAQMIQIGGGRGPAGGAPPPNAVPTPAN